MFSYALPASIHSQTMTVSNHCAYNAKHLHPYFSVSIMPCITVLPASGVFCTVLGALLCSLPFVFCCEMSFDLQY